MSNSRKESRANIYKGLNFGGVSDWAVDLAEYHIVSRPEDVQEDTDGLDETYMWCDGQYTNLDDIPENLSATCGAVYVLQALSSMVAADVKNYTDMLANGYDDKFNTYSDAIVKSAPNIIRDFYMNNGNKYFSCIVTEAQWCCPLCERTYGDFAGYGRCRYCRDDLCTSSLIGSFLNVTGPCPPDFSLRSGQTDEQRLSDTIYWTLLPEKRDQFYADLQADTGIPREFVRWGEVNHVPTECYLYPECYNNGWDFNVPKIAKGYDASDVANPKDTIVSALQRVQDLPGRLSTAAQAIRINAAVGEPSDYVDALALPVLMIRQAVESMAKVMAIADKIDDEKRKALIMLFISAFLFLIPIGGEAIGAIAGLSNVGRFIGLAGEAGMVAMDIYSVVEDPANAPFAIFGGILSAGAFRDATQLRGIANVRRGMKDEDLAKLGSGITDGLGKIRKVVTDACSL
jgi:hypothetical protein